MRYTNIKCVCCGKEFDDNSDVVVCPQCGAPHHRECWQKTGKCSHFGEHSNGYIWQFPQIEEPKNKETVSAPAGEFVFKNGEGIKKCPYCGADNYENDVFCMRCRRSLNGDNTFAPGSENQHYGADGENNASNNYYGDTSGQNNANNPNAEYYNGQNAGPNAGPNAGSADAYYESINRFGGLNPMSELDSIPVIEYSDYVGGAKPGRILRKISVMERFGKNISWSWPAIFIGPAWLFFRKMKKQALIFSLIVLVCSIFTGILSINAPFTEYCKNSLKLIERFATGEITRDAFMTEYNDITNIYTYAELTTEENTKAIIASVLSYITNFGVPVVCSLFGIGFYRKKAKREIEQIRTQCSDMQTYRNMLIKKGGTSVGWLIFGLFVLLLSRFMVSYLPMLIVVMG